MKFEFDSNNVNELRAVEAAVAVLVSSADAEAARAEDMLQAYRDKYPRIAAAWGGTPQTAADHLEAAAQHVTAANRLIAGEELLDRLPRAEQAIQFAVDKRAVQDAALGSVSRVLSSDEPLVAAVAQAQEMSAHAKGDVSAVALGPGRMSGVTNARPVEAVAPIAEQIRQPGSVPTEELDSAGQPWNPELHSSSRAKVADGTWKKKRGAGKAAEPAPEAIEKELKTAYEDTAKAFAAEVPTPPAPPATPVTPPAPPVPAAPLASETAPGGGTASMGQPSAEQKIWALISGGVVTVNQALEAARAAGLADLRALRQADEAKKLEVLRVLEGE